MEEHQPEKFNRRAISIVTVVWTVCFLFIPVISLAVGEASTNPHWSNADPWTLMIFGLALATPMSGLFTALILRKNYSQIKLHHIVLIALGWGMSAIILWFGLSIWILSD